MAVIASSIMKRSTVSTDEAAAKAASIIYCNAAVAASGASLIALI
jgi:hypothetical protein